LAHVQILLGNAKAQPAIKPQKAAPELALTVATEGQGTELAALDMRVKLLREFHRRLVVAGLGETPTAAHVQLALECIATAHRRQHLLQTGEIKPLPAPAEDAADKSYIETAQKLCTGLDAALKSDETAADVMPRKISRLWQEVSH
jgi:hypothetical protein